MKKDSYLEVTPSRDVTVISF